MTLKSWSRTDPLTAVKQTTELDGKVNWWIPPLLHGSLETCFHLKKTCGSPRSLTPYFFMSRVRAFPTVGSWQLQPSLPRHVPRGSRGLAVFAEARALALPGLENSSGGASLPSAGDSRMLHCGRCRSSSRHSYAQLPEQEPSAGTILEN